MRILAVDLGDVRTGFAVCDRSEFLASPVGVVTERNRERLQAVVLEKIRETGAEQVIVGNPINMDGSAGFRSQACTEFAHALAEQTEVPVRLWDERATTVSAHNILSEVDVRGKKRKAVVDAVAAVVILESYLSWRKNHPDEV